MTKRTRWLLLGGGALVVIAAIGGWATWRYGQAAWWAWSAAQPLDVRESTAVAECADPGWTGLLKVLEQDLETGCPSTWFAEQAVASVKAHHPQRARWLRQVLADVDRPARARFRAGSALMLSGREVPPDLVILARAAQVPGSALVDGVQRGAWPVSFADPQLRHRIRVHDVPPDDPDAVADLVLALRHAAVLPVEDEAAHELAEAGLLALGMDPADVGAIMERRQAGLALGSFPSEAVQLVASGGHACTADALGSHACLSWLADALAETTPEPLPEVDLALARGLRSVWAVRDDAEARRVDLLAGQVASTASWIEELEEPEARAARLAALVWGVRSDAGSPSKRDFAVEHVLVAHPGSPWSRASVAWVLGQAAGIEVRVGHDVERGVWLQIGGAARWLGPCGEVSATLADEEPPEAWPERALLAQVAVEEATQAIRRGQDSTARRLARLAERLDARSTVGFTRVVESHSSPPELPSAVVLASSLLSPPPVVPTGAEEARTARAEQLRSTWTAEPACQGS